MVWPNADTLGIQAVPLCVCDMRVLQEEEEMKYFLLLQCSAAPIHIQEMC